MKEKHANRRERRISMGRTESIQSVPRAPDERLKDRSGSFDRIESQPDFVKMVNDPDTLYPPRRPFVDTSPLSSGSDLTLALSPTDTLPEKGIYFKARPPALRLASGTSVPMVHDSSMRYSGYSSADSTVNFALDERLDTERSPTVVEAPLSQFPIRKEPQLSWTLTVLLLVLVTAVGLLSCFVM
jgi:hypothetical protein